MEAHQYSIFKSLVMILFKVSGKSHNSTVYVVSNGRRAAINEWISAQDKDYDWIKCEVICSVNDMVNASNEAVVLKEKPTPINPYSPDGN